MAIDPSKVTLLKIVSGGQTRVDQGALDATERDVGGATLPPTILKVHHI
jgi:hypothetical protein